MVHHFFTLVGLATLAAADVTLTFTKTWYFPTPRHIIPEADHGRNVVDVTGLPHTTVSGGCKATAVVTVTGLNSLDALTSLRDLPCPTGGSGVSSSSEARPAVPTTTDATVRGATTTATPVRPTTQPNAAVGRVEEANRGMGIFFTLVGLATAVHMCI